jgi:pimeloyl-ACP methyl ester carboxylesterase
MTATLPAPAPPARRRAAALRERLARLERPLGLAGLALVTLHLLDLAFSGPDTSVPGVAAILVLAAAWAFAAPRTIRPTRLAIGVLAGLLVTGFAAVSHGLHVVNSGPDLYDVTGVGAILGGLLMAASGLLAGAAPRRAPRRPGYGFRAAHGAGWLAGVPVVGLLVFFPLVFSLMSTHAPRWEIQESSLGIPHQDLRLATADGREVAAWYVPSKNRTAVLVAHGSGGSRERVSAHIRMLARHGYGVLAFDVPGNGESEGHSNGLGSSAQPAVDAALRHLLTLPEVDPERIAGYGSSMGGEVLLETAGREPRLRAVVSDGAARPGDVTAFEDFGLVGDAAVGLGRQALRAVSGTTEAPDLSPLLPRIGARPVLLIAGRGVEAEVLTNRHYRDRIGATAELWEVPNAGHTAGLRTRPEEYERRVTGFLDRALGL